MALVEFGPIDGCELDLIYLSDGTFNASEGVRGGGPGGKASQRRRDVDGSLSDELGAQFKDNPIWWLNRVVTVHALGGCPMGRNAGEGVVDAWGRVYGVPGMHVADGSVMPGPVGPNPSLTIAALADRFADAIIEGRPEP